MWRYSAFFLNGEFVMVAMSLLERLRELKDPRDPKGQLDPFVPLLTLALVATLAGCGTVAAMARFGRLRGAQLGHALGFKSGRMPCANTLTNLFAVLNPDARDAIIAAWLVDRMGSAPEHLAIDGKVLRGSRDGTVPGQHLLAADAPQASAVLAQMRVEATTNEHQVALRMLGIFPSLKGTVVTADAMFTHGDFCEKVLEKEGEYILCAKDNQPDLKAHLGDAFTVAESGDPPPNSKPSSTRTSTRPPRGVRLMGASKPAP